MAVPRFPWVAFCSGAVFAALTLFLLSPFLASPDVPSPIAIRELKHFYSPRQNVFAELATDERRALFTYLHESNNILNLTYDLSSRGQQTWVDQVELLRPNKSDVVSYLDNGGPAPHRYARVSIAEQIGNDSFLADYMVGPLPPSNMTIIQPLIYPYNSGRNWVQTPTPDPVIFYLWAMSVGLEVVDITEDLLGGKVNALDPFSQNSLSIGARPILIEDGKIILWLEFFRTGPGSNGVSLLPQGLYVKLNMESSDSDEWTTSEWFYNGILYPNVDALREAWKSPDFVRLSQNLDGPWTDTEDFDSDPSGRSQPPPLSVQPYGPRYELDRRQHYISWMGFSFYLATSQSTALSLFDVQFNNSRIIYHLGLQEALAHYAGSEPMQSGLEFLDTFFGMGNGMFSLVPGYDCPAYADYLDMTYHKGNSTFTNRNAICIFEYTSDALLQRHVSEWSVTASRNTYLVVRSVSTVGNYDYTIDYLFYLDGSIEVKVRASGFIFAAFAGHTESASPTSSHTSSKSSTDDLRSRSPLSSHPNHRYGYQIHPSASTSMHDHALLFRCDMDISPSPGQNDTFQRVSIEPYTHTYPWDGSSVPKPANTMRLTHHPPLSHESGLNWPRNSAELYLIQSPELNAWGEHKAYRIHAGTGMGTPSHLTILNSTALGKSATWTSSDIWVVKNQASTEPNGAHYLNYLSPNDPLIDFTKIADGEALSPPRQPSQDDTTAADAQSVTETGDDLVLYFIIGTHHIPSSSDIPNTLMHTSASSVVFSPFNYFDEDVSKSSRQGIRVDARTRRDVGWRQGMRVVGGGRYEDFDVGIEGGRYTEERSSSGGSGGRDKRGWKARETRKRKEIRLDIKRDLEPDVSEYFEEEGDDGEKRTVRKNVVGGLLGLWPLRGGGE